MVSSVRIILIGNRKLIFLQVVGIVSEITDFHRVMFYRFDTEMNGCVESELLDPRASEDFFRGESITPHPSLKPDNDVFTVYSDTR